jgi:predicted porin
LEYFYMKKTLVALAVLAASGASFAQATISGNVTMGYLAQTDGGVNGVGGTDKAGLGYDTAAVNFNASEDIGGGYQARVAMTIDQNPRGAAALGENATLSLVTPAGVLTLGTTKGGDYLGTGIAAQGGLYNGYDEKVFGARSKRDSIGYSLPLGSFTIGLSYLETADQLGLGNGTVGAEPTTGQSIVLPSVTYAAGALKVQGQYLAYASKDAAGKNKDVIRGAVSYDFGGFSLGGGAAFTTKTGTAGAANPKVSDYLVSAAVPLGNLTLGANWASRRFDDWEVIGGVSGTVTGYQLQASYALSKRTSVQGNYTRWTQAVNAAPGGTTAGRDASNQYSLLLSHSF